MTKMIKDELKYVIKVKKFSQEQVKKLSLYGDHVQWYRSRLLPRDMAFPHSKWRDRANRMIHIENSIL